MILADGVVTAEIAVAVVGVSWAARSMLTSMFGRKKQPAPVPIPAPAPAPTPSAPKQDDALLVRQLQQAEDRWLKEHAAVERVTRSCEECTRKLDRMCEMFYRFLDELDEKVVPLLTAGPPDTAQAVLLAIRNARTEVREITSH